MTDKKNTTAAKPEANKTVKRKPKAAASVKKVVDKLAFDAKLTPLGAADPALRQVGDDAIQFNAVTHRRLAEAVAHYMVQTMGFHAVRGNALHIWPIEKLYRQRAEINEWAEVEGDLHAVMGELNKLLDAHAEVLRAQLEDKLKRGVLELEDLPVYLKAGLEIVAKVGLDDEVAGPVHDCAISYGWQGQVVRVRIKVLQPFGGTKDGGFCERLMTVSFKGWSGLRDVTLLPVKALAEGDKERISKVRQPLLLLDKGGVGFMRYEGQVSRSGWFGDRTYRASGRVMVDIRTFQQQDNDQHRTEAQASKTESGGGEGGVAAVALTEADLWRTYPFVYGFSFAAKQWGRMRVGGLTEVEWREDAFEKLVLDEDTKELARALVEHNEGSFSDIVDGKGGGTIFLLHGPPGQGKTLLAETVAEVLKRPLYSISVGELGVGPDELEDRLRKILDVATVWNAVLLLDEADIFLEARDEHDILRNAMVGVFLRLLEYHQGVLFLTTNRVRNIDEAFYSRVSIAVEFGGGDAAKRRSIWTNLLAAAGIEGLDTKVLADFDINGRQIKNTIRLSQTLARARGVKVDEDLVRQVVGLSAKFEARNKIAGE